VIGYVAFGQESSVYSIKMIILDSLYLLDVLINVIALRVLGDYSFVNGKWYNLILLIINVPLSVNLFV